MNNGCTLEIDEYCQKSHLTNTHFADIAHQLSLGKFEFDRYLINNNVELLRTEENFRNFHYQIGLPLPAPVAIKTSLINYLYLLLKDIKKKSWEKIKIRNNKAPKCHIFFKKKMILLNETFQQETKNRLENREKIKTCFQEI